MSHIESEGEEDVRYVIFEFKGKRALYKQTFERNEHGEVTKVIADRIRMLEGTTSALFAAEVVR